MGFIYLLYNAAGNGYIGQTKQTMVKRIYSHKDKYNHCSSKTLGVFEWLVLEEVANEDLLDFERYYYDMYNEMFPGMLVNKLVPLTDANENQKKYNKANKEKKKVYCQSYYQSNKARLDEKTKIYNQAKREEINKKHRELYHKKKNIIPN